MVLAVHPRRADDQVEHGGPIEGGDLVERRPRRGLGHPWMILRIPGDPHRRADLQRTNSAPAPSMPVAM